jgi:DNA-directed RNA polymerase specialized sigma24 family protein
MTNEAVRSDLTDEALEALHQTALDAVRNRAGHVNELLAADAASSAIERLVKEVEDGHVIRDREAHVKKAAQDWVDASLNLTAEDLEDLHQAALRGARSVGSRLALLVAEDAANTAMSKVVARIYDGVEIKNPLAYVRAAARNWTLTYIKAANKLPPVDFDDIPHGAGVLRREGDLADMDPGDVVVETEMRKLRELVFRCTLGLLDTRDADILKALRSDEQLSVAQLAARFDFDPDAFTRHRYLIERVSHYAYDSLMHPKLMPETRKYFAYCLERRVGEPDSGIETRIGQALEWLRSHFSDKPTAYPETTHSMLSAAWRINRPGPGRPSIDAKARRRLLAAAADYVLLEGDARPDEEQDGFRDDYEVVRSVRRALGMDAAGAGDTYYTLSG